MSGDLKNHQQKCRLCFQPIKTARSAVEISEEIQQNFLDLTNLELIASHIYSNAVCKPCVASLQESLKFKENILKNQRKLYAAIDPQGAMINIKEEPEEVLEVFPIVPDFTHEDVMNVKTECFEFENEMNEFADFPRLALKKEKPKRRSEKLDPCITCKYCSKVVKRQKAWRHYARHENKLNNIFFYCDLCNYKAHVKENLSNHMKSHYHYEDSELACSFCPKIFSSGLLKKCHERSSHLTQNENLCCDKCGKTCLNKTRLSIHIREYHVLGDFPCNKCDKVFHRKSDLYSHRASHRVVEIACEICGKLVKNNGRYNVHLASHGPPKFQCPVDGCVKTYASASSFKYHVENEHEAPKNVECPMCNSVYPNQGKLKRHIQRSHTEPSFFCEVLGCGYKSTRKDYLKLHLRNHKDIDIMFRDDLLKKLGGKIY